MPRCCRHARRDNDASDDGVLSADLDVLAVMSFREDDFLPLARSDYDDLEACIARLTYFSMTAAV